MDKTRRVKGGGPIVSDPSLASVIIEAGKQPNVERWGGSGAARTASTWKKPGREKKFPSSPNLSAFRRASCITRTGKVLQNIDDNRSLQLPPELPSFTPGRRRLRYNEQAILLGKKALN